MNLSQERLRLPWQALQAFWQVWEVSDASTPKLMAIFIGALTKTTVTDWIPFEKPSSAYYVVKKETVFLLLLLGIGQVFNYRKTIAHLQSRVFDS